MSITVTNCEQINSNPCNNSPSKQLFSFSKQDRFRTPRPYNKLISYEPKSCFDNIKHKHVKTTFGVQRPKLFFSKERAYKPSPDRYTLQTAFKNTRNSMGKKSLSGTLQPSVDSRYWSESKSTFGAARDAYANVVSASGFNYIPFKKEAPGPAHYAP